MKSPRSVIAATALAAAAATVAATAQANASGLPPGGPGGAGSPGGPGVSGGSATTAAAGAHHSATGTADTRLANSAVPFATTDKMVAAVPASTKLTVQFWLAPQAAAAESLANAVSAPGNPLFRHFLSPAAYTSRYGATPQEAASIEQWLASEHFTGIAPDAGRDYVRATAPVGTINAAMKIRLNYYKATPEANAGTFPLRANDRPISLPAGVASSVIGVTGLDNAAPVMTYAKPWNPAATGTPKASPPSFPCSQWYAQHHAAGLPKQFRLTTFPTIICGYTPQQLRRAYGYSSVNEGKGVTVALVEVGLTRDMYRTLQTYASVHGLPAPSAQRYAELPIGRGSACGDPFNTEEQLDVESSYTLAPMAKQLVIGGDSCDNGDYGLQALYNADLAVLNGKGGHPLARIASNSWEGGDETIPANLLTIQHDYLLRAAVEGVTMLFSSGDSSGVAVPSSDPYATAVGGTTLAMGHDNRIFETGWSTGISTDSNGAWVSQGEQGAAGGGASLLWQQPSYQEGVVPAAMAHATGNRGGLVRAVPDISAVADPFTGMTVGMLSFDARGNVTGYFEQSIGGTSLAAPVIAGILADAEQGNGAFGFINPALYKLAKAKPTVYNDAKPLTAKSSGNYRGVACDAATCGVLSLTTFVDQSWNMLGYTGQVTAPGYDTMTGIGTPNGQKFISALRALLPR